MIQDIYPHKYDNSYKNVFPKDTDLIVVVLDQKILLKQTDGNIVFPSFIDYPSTAGSTYLFSVDDIRFFRAYPESLKVFTENGFEFMSYNSVMNLSPQHLAYSALVAINLCTWYDSNKYCGRCGSYTVHDKKERMLLCPKCGNMIYPRINPVVIVAVTNKNKLLLTRYKGVEDQNRVSLVAGFVEIGETIEEAARREVKEESGVNIKNLRFYKSQPWPMSGSVLFGLFCDLDGPDDITIQEEELSFAGWVERKNIPARENLMALTAEMIDAFIKDKYPC